MQRILALFVLVTVAAAALMIGSGVAWVAHQRFTAISEHHAAAIRSDLLQRIQAYDQLIADTESQLNARLNNIMPSIEGILAPWQNALPNVPLDLLNDFCRNNHFESAYIIDAKGIVVATNFAPDLHLDLRAHGDSMVRFLDGLYGSGRVVNDRFGVSVQTGMVKKYVYFSPKDSHYVFEVAIDLKDLFRGHAAEHYRDALIAPVTESRSRETSAIESVDAFILYEAHNSWSMFGTGTRLDAAVASYFNTSGEPRFRRNVGDRVEIYERHGRSSVGGGTNPDMITLVAYSTSEERALQRQLLIIVLGIVLVASVAAYVMGLAFLNRLLIHPVERIVERLQHAAAGDYAECEETGGEVTRSIARGLNVLQQRIQKRQAELRTANTTLEERVQIRTRELEQLNQRLEAAANTDSLTGLYNRRAFLSRFEVERDRSRRNGRPFVVAMLDLDHFKDVNDRYGHQLGDEVLCVVAEVIRRRLRSIDLAARWGGEEFLMMLPETGTETARVALERIRAELSAHGFEAAEELVVTVSIGYTTVVQHDIPTAAIIEQADRALYAAKQAGRNRVCEYLVDMNRESDEAND